MTLLAIIAWAIAFPALAQLRIVATTAELHSLASAVGGDAVAVSHLIPAGGAPYEFDEYNLSDFQPTGVVYPGYAYPDAVAMTSAPVASAFSTF
jgi:hypothetical protein